MDEDRLIDIEFRKALSERELELATLELKIAKHEAALRKLRIKQDRTKTEMIGLQFLLED